MGPQVERERGSGGRVNIGLLLGLCHRQYCDLAPKASTHKSYHFSLFTLGFRRRVSHPKLVSKVTLSPLNPFFLLLNNFEQLDPHMSLINLD